MATGRELDIASAGAADRHAAAAATATSAEPGTGPSVSAAAAAIPPSPPHPPQAAITVALLTECACVPGAAVCEELRRERAGASFSPDLMAVVLYGGEKRLQRLLSICPLRRAAAWQHSGAACLTIGRGAGKQRNWWMRNRSSTKPIASS